MLYAIATSFYLETTTPFPVSSQLMKLSPSLIVPFLCLFVCLFACLFIFCGFFSLFFSFVFFFVRFWKILLPSFPAPSATEQPPECYCGFLKWSRKEARSSIQDVALAQAAMKGKSDKFRFETYFAAMTSAIALQNQNKAQNGPTADLTGQTITDLLRTKVCDLSTEVFSVSIYRNSPKVNTVVHLIY